jgi:hypothetical protein|tara:strand:- start:1136 stop:1648 length:513 start_codon:yes stop_codon:yes gene_type:complete
MFLELVKSKHVPIKDRIKFMIELHAKLGKQITKEQAKKLVNEDKLPTQVMYANEDYLVQVYDKELADEMVHTDDLKGKCTWLSIRRQDRGHLQDWADLQQIKNFICGKTREAIQLYPSEDRLIDTANQYHLIVFPQDVLIPFGWHVGRTVSSESVEVNNSKTKQRLKNVL